MSTWYHKQFDEIMNHERLTGESKDYFFVSLESVKPATRFEYTRLLVETLDEFNQNTEELYEEILSLINSQDRRKIKGFEHKINSYLSDLMGTRKLSLSTIEQRAKALNRFFKANMLNYRYRFKPSGDLKENEETRELFYEKGKDAIQPDEINQLLELSGNPRDHAIIMLLKDSGLRVSDIAELKVKHVRPILEDRSMMWHCFEIVPVKNLVQKTPLPAYPCLGADSINYLHRWIDYAQRKFGAFTTIEDEDYLLFLTNKGEGNRVQMNGFALSNVIQYNLNKGSFRKDISAHSFRKTHQTKLQAGGVPERWINVMQGRKGVGTQGIYTKPNKEELLEAYKRGYSQLQLEPEVDARFEELEEENQAIKQELERMKSLEAEVAEIRKSIMKDSGMGFSIVPNQPIRLYAIGEEARNKKEKEGYETLGVVNPDDSTKINPDDLMVFPDGTSKKVGIEALFVINEKGLKMFNFPKDDFENLKPELRKLGVSITNEMDAKIYEMRLK